jgi:hypothetical protein
MSLYQNPSLFTESVSARTATPTVALGTVRYEGGNRYRYVYCETLTQPGSCVNLASGGSGYTVVASMVTGDFVYGIVQDATLSATSYGWVLVEGIGKITQDANTALAASRLICGLSSNSLGDYQAKLTVALTGSVSGGSFATFWINGVCGRTLTSGTASGLSILAAIQCKI